MNDLDYLNQISADNRKAKSSGFSLGGLTNIISPKLLKWILIAIAAVIFVVIVGGMFGGESNKEKDIVERISLRSTNISGLITQQNNNIKSPQLRSMARSLGTVLTETSRNVTVLLASEFSTSEEVEEDSGVAAEEAEYLANLTLELENARLSAQLDKTYLRILTLQISLILSMESEAMARTDKDSVVTTLTSSMASLSNLKDQFDSFEL